MVDRIHYELAGFNVSLEGTFDKSISLDADIVVEYDNHDFIKNIRIDKDFKFLEVNLLDKDDCSSYQKEVVYEVERILFNLMAYIGIPVNRPRCRTTDIRYNSLSSIFINEYASMAEIVTINRVFDSMKISEKIKHIQTPIIEEIPLFEIIKEILQIPQRVLQYMALYDVLKDLVCSNQERQTQKAVTDFFKEHKEKYPQVQITSKSGNRKGDEDSLTHLRNMIAHSIDSKDIYAEVVKSISFDEISIMLRVINDILLERTKNGAY